MIHVSPPMPADARPLQPKCRVPELAFFATSAKGLEEVLADELRALGVSNVLPGTGGVHFHGRPADGYRACLWLRTPTGSCNRWPRSPVNPRSSSTKRSQPPWEAHLTPAMTWPWMPACAIRPDPLALRRPQGEGRHRRPAA